MRASELMARLDEKHRFARAKKGDVLESS